MKLRASLVILFCRIFIASAKLNFAELSENCLDDMTIYSMEHSCESQNEVRMFITPREDGEIFYCITYEKTGGKQFDFDLIEFKFDSTVSDFEYKGASILQSDLKNPIFKVFKSTEKVYKARFIFGSDDPEFKINKISINRIGQVCKNKKNGNIVWQSNTQEEIETTTQVQPNRTTTTRKQNKLQSTRQKKITTTTPIYESHLLGKLPCGIVQNTTNLKMFGLSSNPGEFPWTVAIFRYKDYDESSSYKCSGTIIDERRILTSVNCLLEDGEILSTNDVKVHTAKYSLSAKTSRKNVHDVKKFQYKNFAINLDNNIAIITLKKDIEFNDFVQPVCLPDASIRNQQIGKLAGFGKQSSEYKSETEVLNEAEYVVEDSDDLDCSGKTCPTFVGLNTSGNIRISDLGSGLYISDKDNKWSIAGIVSKSLHYSKRDHEDKVLFVNVAHYSSWIEDSNDQ